MSILLNFLTNHMGPYCTVGNGLGDRHTHRHRHRHIDTDTCAHANTHTHTHTYVSHRQKQCLETRRMPSLIKAIFL